MTSPSRALVMLLPSPTLARNAFPSKAPLVLVPISTPANFVHTRGHLAVAPPAIENLWAVSCFAQILLLERRMLQRVEGDGLLPV